MMAKDMSVKFEQLCHIIELCVPENNGNEIQLAMSDDWSLKTFREEPWTLLKVWNVNQKLVDLVNRLSSVFGPVRIYIEFKY